MSRRVLQPRAGLAAPLVAVLVASPRPLLTMAGLMVGVGLLAGLLAGDLTTPLAAAMWGVGVTWSSLVLHEWGHLLAHRWRPERRADGHVCAEWTGVWVSLPATGPLASRLTALAGPALGVLTCGVWLAIGAPAWITGLVALVHGGNLLPSFADGRVLFRGA